MQVLDVDNPPDEKIDGIIAGIKDGSVVLPDFRQRLG